MRSLVVLFLLAPCVFCNPEPRAIPTGSCGVNKYNTRSLFASEPFIVGGKTAVPNTYPWQVSLRAFGSHMCGGSIISDQYILTAAHCFSSYNSPSYWTVAAGKHSIAAVEASEKIFNVAQITRHEKYNSMTNANDVTILKLSSKIDFNDFIQPVCLPDAAIGTLEGQNAVVTGWGATREGGSGATLLQEVTVPIISNTKCQQKYADETIDSGMICAGLDAGGKDACQGDSGGPFVYKVGGKWVHIGVVSWGYGCAAPNQPGVYTRTSQFLSWIKSKMV